MNRRYDNKSGNYQDKKRKIAQISNNEDISTNPKNKIKRTTDQ